MGDSDGRRGWTTVTVRGDCGNQIIERMVLESVWLSHPCDCKAASVDADPDDVIPVKVAAPVVQRCGEKGHSARHTSTQQCHTQVNLQFCKAASERASRPRSSLSTTKPSLMC